MDIQTYLSNICQHCGLEESEVTLTIDDSNGEDILIQLDVPEDNIGLFIGNRGETLAALQRLTRIVFHDQFPDKRIALNINDYREERKRQLEEKAEEVGHSVLESGRPYRFPFLSSYERFIVHSIISGNEAFSELESVSLGEGKQRRLVVQFKDDQDTGLLESEEATEADQEHATEL